jgi:hypothetical protein
MLRTTNLDFEIRSYSVRLQNDGSMLGAGWNKTSPRPLLLFPPAKSFHFEVIPRPPWAKKDWFPLPYYTVNRMFTPLWHHLNLSYWLLLLVYLGLWQLPWLARYHRRRRIDRALAIAPPEPTTASPD